jgi:proliferating cell nuclear antigen
MKGVCNVSTLETQISQPVARIKYPDAKVFREFIEALGKIVEEARFTVNENGVKVVGMDPAKVALIEIEMPSEAFLEYEVQREIDMGLNLESLSDAIKRGKKGDTISFLITDDKVLVKLETQTGAIKRYLTPNLEISIDVPENPKLEHDVEASVISDTLKRVIRDAEAVGDLIVIEAEEGELRFKGYAEGKSKMEMRLKEGSPALIYLEVKNPSTSAYDIAHLKNVLNLTKVAAAVDLKFSSDKPLELVFKSTEGSRVRYLLAPTSISEV